MNIIQRLFCQSSRIDRALARIINLGESIMAKIQEFAAVQRTFNDRMNVAIDGLVGDIQHMTALIETLQTTPGPISAEDQATLDELQVAGEAATAKAEAADALTPPAVPA